MSTRFDDMIDKNLEVFFLKYYDEKTLGSFKTIPMIRDSLVDYVVKAYTDESPNPPRWLSLKLHGFFNEDKDAVLYDFKFSYDKAAASLDFLALTARYNGVSANYIKDPKDIPNAVDVFSELRHGFELRTDKEMVLDRLENIRKADAELAGPYSNSAYNIASWLFSNEFFSRAASTPFLKHKYSRALENLATGIESAPDISSRVFVKQTGRRIEDTNVDFRVFFSVHPKNQEIKLDGLSATSGRQRKDYRLENTGYHFPAANIASELKRNALISSVKSQMQRRPKTIKHRR